MFLKFVHKPCPGPCLLSSRSAFHLHSMPRRTLSVQTCMTTVQCNNLENTSSLMYSYLLFTFAIFPFPQQVSLLAFCKKRRLSLRGAPRNDKARPCISTLYKRRRQAQQSAPVTSPPNTPSLHQCIMGNHTQIRTASTHTPSALHTLHTMWHTRQAHAVRSSLRGYSLGSLCD